MKGKNAPKYGITNTFDCLIIRALQTSLEYFSSNYFIKVVTIVLIKENSAIFLNIENNCI